MVKFICKYCNSEKFMLRESGNATGLYCEDCGKWYKWLDKDELRVVQNHLENEKKKESKTVLCMNIVEELSKAVNENRSTYVANMSLTQANAFSYGCNVAIELLSDLLNSEKESVLNTYHTVPTVMKITDI